MQNSIEPAIFAQPSIANLERSVSEETESSRFMALDTSFVLFFLAMEIGRSGLSFGIGTALSLFTLAAFAILPYFLPFSDEKAAFKSWISGRAILSAVGITLGMMLGAASGVALPEAARFLPMVLLIVAAIISCNVQLYAILRYRLAR